MASEDSDQITPRCPAVHRLCNFRDLDETVWITMQASIDHAHTAGKPFKVRLLCRMQRMSLKERNYRSKKISPPIYDELGQMLAMVIVALCDIDSTDPEKALQLLQRRPAADTLRHNKPMRYLIPGFVALTVRAVMLPNKTNGEAPLPIYKAHCPPDLNQPFLLVFCTHDIFTVPLTWDDTRSLGYSDVPAYSRMRTTWLPIWGAAFYLRTVIVTAAVYRGLASLLRVKP
jgi:hypothetical protein